MKGSHTARTCTDCEFHKLLKGIAFSPHLAIVVFQGLMERVIRYTGNSRLHAVSEVKEVTDDPKPRLKQNQ